MASTDEKRIMDALLCSSDEAREVLEIMRTFGMDKVLAEAPQPRWLKDAKRALIAVRIERRDLLGGS